MGDAAILNSDLPAILFGGPDQPERPLRDRLQDLVDHAPSGSRIDWATYYFRDRALAQALVRASDRGVRVRLVLEPHPRLAGANDTVASLLEDHGLAGGFRLRRRLTLKGRLHAKIYVFSQPDAALVGSFNPSGDRPEDPEITAEIGDQDRGYNLLYAIRDPAVAEALRRHVAFLGETRASLLDRFRPRLNRVVQGVGLQVAFYPRLRTDLVEAEVADLGRGDAVDAAVSHLKDGPMMAALARASAAGAVVRLLVHATERRVPGEVVARLAAGGMEAIRVGDGHAAPMHNKFVVLTRAGVSHAWLGSYNYNDKSRWRNDELLVRTEAAEAVQALRARLEAMRVAP